MRNVAFASAASLLSVLLLWAPPTTAQTEEALMKAGLEALYTAGDPEAAAAQFRKVLDLNPTHYGAIFQLAMALGRAGKPAEALPLWEKALTMAQRYDDKATLTAAAARLDADRQKALMQAGLDALYARREPAVAAAEFRKVLDLNPTHYGATFQLTMALDQGGKRDEARPVWQRVLTMAEGYGDTDTATAARARLAEQR